MALYPDVLPLAHNQLLTGMSPEVIGRLTQHARVENLAVGQLPYHQGEPIDEILFPTDSIIAWISTLENGATAQLALIGNDGIVGVNALIDGNSIANSPIVLCAGGAVAISRQAARKEFARKESFHDMVWHYTLALLLQSSQTAICNRYHSIKQQLGRWLLFIHDHAALNELLLTQETIASMLGVRRESVSHAIGQLSEVGLLDHKRGHIRILNRAGIEAATCECYRIVKGGYERLLQESNPRSPDGLASARGFTATSTPPTFL